MPVDLAKTLTSGAATESQLETGKPRESADLYFRRFAFTTPVRTGLVFVGVVVGLDLFLVAPVFVGDFTMFASVLGTWIPFAAIFSATLLTGWITTGRGPPAHAPWHDPGGAGLARSPGGLQA